MTAALINNKQAEFLSRIPEEVKFSDLTYWSGDPEDPEIRRPVVPKMKILTNRKWKNLNLPFPAEIFAGDQAGSSSVVLDDVRAQ